MLKHFKRCLLVGIIVILLAGTATAFEFDNVRSYNKDSRTLTVTNAFGLGKTIANLQLISDDTVYVIPGKDRQVAEFTIENFESYDFFGKIEFYTKSNMKKTTRSFELKYKYLIGQEIKEKFVWVCDEPKILINGTLATNCYHRKSGTYTKDNYIWKPLSIEDNLPKGTITIGIFTDVYSEDYVEWIPTFIGERINEWASWAVTLNPVSFYYPFEETAGTTVSDSIGNHNGTFDNAPTWSAGKIGNAAEFTGNQRLNVSQSPYTNLNEDFSFWLWFNVTSGNSGGFLGNWNGSGADLTNWFQSALYIGQKFHLGIRDNGGTEASKFSDSAYDDSLWHFLVVTYNETDNIWNATIDDVQVLNLTADIDGGNDNFYLGARYSRENLLTGKIDEFGYKNKTLIASEKTQLYSLGEGMTYSSYEISLNVPLDDGNYINPVDFNCTANSTLGTNFVNLSLWIDGSLNKTVIDAATFLEVNASLNMSLGSHNYTCWVWDATAGTWGGNYTFDVNSWQEESQSKNSSTYETATENFILNITYDSSLLTSLSSNLIYNGTSYAGTKSGSGENVLFVKELTIPLSANHGEQENRSFHWEVGLVNSSGTTWDNSTFYNQSVNPINLSIFDASNNVAFINFTFKDEEAETAVSGRIDSSTWYYWLGDGSVNRSLSYSTSADVKSIAFAFDPPDKTLSHTTTVQYSNVTTPQRRWSYSLDLTNTTLNKVLYLLSTVDGSYSTYQVQDSQGASVQGVSITVERKISGTWTLMESGTTDSAGAVTFWLNPDYDHRIVATKSGYSSFTATIRPSQSTYTITMTALGAVAADYNFTLEGIKWEFAPKLGFLMKDAVYTFTFNLTASLGNLAGCKMELEDGTTDAILNSTTGCGSYGGNLSTVLNTTYVDYKLFGNYYVDFGDGYVLIDSDAYWFTNITYEPKGGIWEGLSRMASIKAFGDETGRAEYSRIVFFFLMLVIIMGFISYSTGWDIQNPGGMLWFLCGVIWFFSFAGWFSLSDITPWAVTDKYIVAFIISMVTVGYTGNLLRRAA